MSEITFEILGEPQGRVHTTAIPIVRSKCPVCRAPVERSEPVGDKKNLRRCLGCTRVYRQFQAVNAAKASDAQKVWVATAKDAAAKAMAEAGLDKIEEGAVELGLEFIMPRPQRFIWKNPHPEPRHWRMPDRDNLEKALKDAFRGILWRDDAQVSEGPLSKRYARPGEACRAVVTVRVLGEWYEELVEMSLPQPEAKKPQMELA